MYIIHKFVPTVLEMTKMSYNKYGYIKMVIHKIELKF